MIRLNSEEVIAESLQRIEKVFRGSFIIRGNDVLKWTLYFSLGRLSWVTGGINFRERLQRHLVISCPQITSKVLQEIPLEYQPEQEQKILVSLQGQGLITRSQMTRLMENIAVEVLFDAIQYGKTETENLSCHKNATEENNNLLLLLPVLDLDLVLNRAMQEWNSWKNACLENYSPNLYPIIKQPNLLQESVENNKQQKIINYINNTRTLRDIATKSGQNLVETTLFLISLLDSGAILLSNLPESARSKTIDTEKPLLKKSVTLTLSKISHKKNDKQPDEAQAKPNFLIACIDNNPLVCQTVKKIVVEQKYRFLDIQKPIQIIPTLLKNKPDLIFLDLMMPVNNGYELCAQMRKIPSLENVPVIIFTEKNSLVDRMRGKLVGSTDFITKPVKTFPILQMLDKYIMVKQSPKTN